MFSVLLYSQETTVFCIFRKSMNTLCIYVLNKTLFYLSFPMQICKRGQAYFNFLLSHKLLAPLIDYLLQFGSADLVIINFVKNCDFLSVSLRPLVRYNCVTCSKD